MSSGRILVSATSKKGLTYFHRIQPTVPEAKLLDFRPQYAGWLRQWTKDQNMVTLPPKRAAFLEHAMIQGAHAAVIFEDDFVETALVTQALKNANVSMVYVVTPDHRRAAVYRKVGADYAGVSVPNVSQLFTNELTAV